MSTDAFVAPNAAVIGSVTINTRSAVMYGAVVRGDLNEVEVGAYTTIGDRAVISTTKSVEGHVSAGVRIGNHVSIGPGALLQSCTVEDAAVIGAGAIVMEGALVESFAQVGEGAVVHPGRRIPSGELWAGNPAVFVRPLTKMELAGATGHAEEAADVASEHAHEFLPYTTAYQQAERLGVTDAVRWVHHTLAHGARVHTRSAHTRPAAVLLVPLPLSLSLSLSAGRA
ncbi:gamma carbonic anhydrase family protein [archaeon]|nr:MAG: gamma carbonic anhydrase family protein [archaeon]